MEKDIIELKRVNTNESVRRIKKKINQYNLCKDSQIL